MVHQSGNDDARHEPARMVSPAELLVTMEQHGERIIAGLLSSRGLTPPQARVLSALRQHGPDLALPELARKTGFPLGAVTSIMDRLLVWRFVVREPHPMHGQALIGSLTQRGHDVMDQIEAAKLDLLDEVAAGFTDDEMDVIARLAERLERMVERHDEDADVPHHPPGEPDRPLLRVIRGDQA